jgi:hypothetical protein
MSHKDEEVRECMLGLSSSLGHGPASDQRSLFPWA